MTVHSDIVVNQWLAGYQERVGRISIDYDRADLVAKMLTEVAERWDGDYLFVTTPHSTEDCPFRGGDRLAMKQIVPERP